MLSVTLISCVPCCFINHEKGNKRIHYSVNLPNKGNKIFLSFFSFLFFFFSFWYQLFNKKLITHYTKLDSTCIKQYVYTFFFYSFPLSCCHSSHSLRNPSLRLSKSSTLPFRKIPVFQGVSHLQTNFNFILRHPSLGLSNSSLTLQ